MKHWLKTTGSLGTVSWLEQGNQPGIWRFAEKGTQPYSLPVLSLLQVRMRKKAETHGGFGEIPPSPAGLSLPGAGPGAPLSFFPDKPQELILFVFPLCSCHPSLLLYLRLRPHSNCPQSQTHTYILLRILKNPRKTNRRPRKTPRRELQSLCFLQGSCKQWFLPAEQRQP